MSGRYFCYDCQAVVPAIHPPTRHDPTCLYCLRGAVEKISEEEDFWFEDASETMNDPQLDTALNLLERLTVQPSSVLLDGSDNDNDYDAYDTDNEWLGQFDPYPSSPLPGELVDLIDDSFSDTPSFLAGYLGIVDPDENDDWISNSDSLSAYVVNDGYHTSNSDDNHDHYDSLLQSVSQLQDDEVSGNPTWTEISEHFQDFMLRALEASPELPPIRPSDLDGTTLLGQQAMPLNWLDDAHPPRANTLDQSRFDALPSRILGEDDDVIRTKTDCVICQETFQIGMTLVRMACNHEYHKDCLLPWLHQSPTCPVCRNTL